VPTQRPRDEQTPLLRNPAQESDELESGAGLAHAMSWEVPPRRDLLLPCERSEGSAQCCLNPETCNPCPDQYAFYQLKSRNPCAKGAACLFCHRMHAEPPVMPECSGNCDSRCRFWWNRGFCMQGAGCRMCHRCKPGNNFGRWRRREAARSSSTEQSAANLQPAGRGRVSDRVKAEFGEVPVQTPNGGEGSVG
jgi:hypothetical protein